MRAFPTLDAVSNSATWVENCELRDDETDELIDLSSATEITLTLRDPGSRTNVLTGSKTNGEITVTDTGVFEWEFSESQMGALQAKTYQLGCTIEQNGRTTQVLIGFLPVLDGIVQ